MEVDVYRDHRFTAVTRAFVIVAVLVAFSGPFAGSAHAADKTVVKLGLALGFTGAPRVNVQPPYAKIWRNKPGKPNEVVWRMYYNKTSYYEVFWEFRYDSSKGGDTPNYFGDVDLGCGQKEIKVQPDKKPDSPNAEWPYTITAYACADGVKAQKIATLKARIIWKD